MATLPLGAVVFVGCDFPSTLGTRGAPAGAKNGNRARAFVTTIGRAVRLPSEITGFRLRGMPRYSPDGNRLAVTTVDDGNIYICGLDGDLLTDIRNVIGSDPGHTINGCAWLTESALLVYEAWMTDADRNRFEEGGGPFAIRWSTRTVNLNSNAIAECDEYTADESVWLQVAGETRFETINGSRVVQIDPGSGRSETVAIAPDGCSFATGWSVPAGFALAVRNLMGNLAGDPADMILYDFAAQAIRTVPSVPYSPLSLVVADSGNYIITLDPSERAVVIVDTRSNERRSLGDEFWIPIDYCPARRALLVNVPQEPAAGGRDQFYEVPFGQLFQ
ncbi:MAG: hypothetical protein JNG88_12705 [Phycisphaerales bacterium]|nr:hypothetical protein [Phycisphaerales bacterium]